MGVRWLRAVGFAADALATLAFAAFVGAVTAQVLYRYAGVSLPFSEELARLLNLYAVFLGAAVATRLDAHIRIDVVDHWLGPRPRLARAVAIGYDLLALVFLVILGLGSALMVPRNWDIPLATMAWLNNGHIYLAPAVGSGLMALLTAARLAGRLRATVA